MLRIRGQAPPHLGLYLLLFFSHQTREQQLVGSQWPEECTPPTWCLGPCRAGARVLDTPASFWLWGRAQNS